MGQQILMAQRAARPEQTPEAEPIVVDVVECDDPQRTKLVVLTLDDGETLTLDREELRASIDETTRRAA